MPPETENPGKDQQKPQFFVMLPAYNEEETLPPLLDSLLEVFPKIDGRCSIIVVNDGSTDQTQEVLNQYANKHNCIRPVIHEQNQGLGPAIRTGLRSITEQTTRDLDIIVCMDADNTHPPETIPAMIECLNQGADIVIASRYRPGSRQIGVPLFRRILSRTGGIVFKLVLGLKGVRDYTCGFRAYRVEVIRKGFEKHGDQIISRSGFACTDELLVKLAPECRRIDEVPFILRYDRKRGASKLPFWSTVRATLHLLISRK